jgi:hypothetical protein
LLQIKRSGKRALGSDYPDCIVAADIEVREEGFRFRLACCR